MRAWYGSNADPAITGRVRRSARIHEVVMPKHNLATVERNSSRYPGRSPRVERSRVCIETERVSRERRRPSGDAPRAVVAGPWSFPGKTTAAERSIALAAPAMSFGPFHVLPYQRLLLEGDRPLRLGSRALDILGALVERAGALVSKGELMARAWHDILGDEGKL